jgi:iron(III) transport system substrate-binding protein
MRAVISRLVPLAVLVFLTAACSSGGQAGKSQQQSQQQASTNWPSTISGVAAYQAPDRDQMLASGAQTEGSVTLVTSLAGPILDELTKGFNQKYPNIKLNVNRPAGENGIAILLTEEAKAQKYTADVVESPPGSALLTVRYELKSAVPYYTPAAKDYPPDSQEPASDKRLDYWVYDRENFVGFGYNTNALPASAVPKTFKDLLNPELKSKMQITNTSFTVFIDNILQNQGQAYAQQLAQQQDFKVQDISAKAMFDLVASGEVAASPSLYNDHAEIEARAGAPVKWVALEPATANLGGLVLVDHAPHPHAAMLLIDYLLSPDGQKVFSANAYDSPSKQPDFKVWYPTKGLTVDQYEKHYNDAQDFLNKYFIKSGG